MTEPAVLPAIAALREEMVTLRRHIHAHPELGFEERRTATLVAECLEAWGYQVSRGVG
ncbi:TPA: amidohydrolase, partial [Pseudomonas aeruginosa]